MRRKIITGHAACISQSGVAKCGGVVERGVKMHPVASSPNMRAKTTLMRRSNSADTKKKPRNSDASVAKNKGTELSSAQGIQIIKRWHHVIWSKNEFKK